MDSFECAGNDVCRQYCQALESQGVDVEIRDAGVCNVPDMFVVDAAGVSFDPKPAENVVANTELVNELGGALMGALLERGPNSAEQDLVEDLIDAFSDTQQARLDMWQGMLGAVRDRRVFTDVELGYHQREIAAKQEALDLRVGLSMQDVSIRARAAVDNLSLKDHRLLFDEQMVGVVDRLVSNLMDSKSTLLVGDKGIAKTQAAKFVTKMWSDEAPLIISGHGDMMSNEFMGQMEQDPETGLFVFKDGKLVQAMREGRPVIVDEVNIGDQTVVMRLQDILLLPPGEKVIIQENGRDAIEIQPGFVVFATANEASTRYQHRSVLDPAFRDRYDLIELEYPDSQLAEPLKTVPQSLMRLAFAAAVDGRGVMSKHINSQDLKVLTRLAHVTQHLYSVPAKSARAGAVTDSAQATSTFLDEEPAMNDCISPRTLFSIIERCAQGNKPNMTLVTEMERVIKGLDQAGSTRNQTYARKALQLLKQTV